MPAKDHLDPEQIVWVPPEALDRSRGEYRVVEGYDESENRISPVYGDRAVWVDENPGDPEDGSGHWERYAGNDEDYRPTVEGDA